MTIKNEEDKEWAINPTISTSSSAAKGYFTGNSTFVIPPKSQANYVVTYTPKTMTKKDKKEDGTEADAPHTGSLFFPLPNGNA